MKLSPMLLGLCGAIVILGGKWLLTSFLNRGNQSFRQSIFLVLVGIASAAGAVFVQGDVVLRFALAGISALLFLGALGSALKWPGFTSTPPDSDRDNR